MATESTATEDYGVFVPPPPAPRPDSMEVVRAFRDVPSRATHQECAALLAKCGPLCLDGRVYSLKDGRVVSEPAVDRAGCM